MTFSQAELPGGWDALGPERARQIEEELTRELNPVHRLYGVAVQAVAARSSNDDTLLRHTGDADCWSVVHLTWSGQREGRDWPTIEFTGTFAEFCAAFTSPL